MQNYESRSRVYNMRITHKLRVKGPFSTHQLVSAETLSSGGRELYTTWTRSFLMLLPTISHENRHRWTSAHPTSLFLGASKQGFGFTNQAKSDSKLSWDKNYQNNSSVVQSPASWGNQLSSWWACLKIHIYSEWSRQEGINIRNIWFLVPISYPPWQSQANGSLRFSTIICAFCNDKKTVD